LQEHVELRELADQIGGSLVVVDAVEGAALIIGNSRQNLGNLGC
jgi:hypothetical protein